MQESLTDISKQIKIVKDNFSETKQSFELKTNNFKNECLWRIKDAEELLKSRIS